MLLKRLENKFSSKKWKDKNKIEWDYITSKQFQQQTEGKAFLFGDIGIGNKKTNDILINENYNKLPVYSPKQKLGFFQKINGYIECIDENNENNGFVRIINLSLVKIISVILIVLILLSVIIGFSIKNKDEVKLDKAAVAYQMPNGAKNTDPNMISLPGLSEIFYKKSDNKVVTPLINPEGNECYFQYKIILSKNNEVVYQSKNIKPGTALIDFKLNRSLQNGEYDVIVIAEATSLNNPDQQYNAGQISAKLKVIE